MEIAALQKINNYMEKMQDIVRKDAGKSYLIYSVAIGGAVCVVNITAMVVYVYLRFLFAGENLFEDSGNLEAERSIFSQAFGAVVFAPLAETIVMALIFDVIDLWSNLKGLIFALSVGVLAGVLHPHFPPSFIFFVVVGCQYFIFYRTIGASKAFWGVSVAHSVHNAGIMAISLLPF